jgi:hypothetical protein
MKIFEDAKTLQENDKKVLTRVVLMENEICHEIV